MPREKTPHIIEEEPTDKRYITLPRVEGMTLNHILTVLLVVAAFLIGSLFTKVQYLEKGTKSPKVESANTTATAPTSVPVPTTPTHVTVSNGHLPAKGNDNAKVTIVEFADFRCPFCEQFFTNVEPQLIKDYVDTGKAKIYFRHYAFLGDASVLAANAAECANDQGKFWDMHDYFYKNQPPETDTSMYTVDNLTTVAGTLGMDTTQFNSCLTAKKDDANVSGDLSDGQKATVTATPTFIINGTVLVGAQPFSAFQSAIDAALKS